MCTVTVYKREDRVFLTMNRDESKYRHEAGVLHKEQHCIFPLDPESKGTWVGCNQTGLAAALLNNYQGVLTEGQKTSRGAIIPRLLENTTLDEGYHHLQNIDYHMFNPFNLIITDGEKILRASWDGITADIFFEPFTDRFFITSSSEKIEAYTVYRTDIFDQFNLSCFDGSQGNFSEIVRNHLHLTTYKGRERGDIFMEREHVHTKSVTQICLQKDEVEIFYWPEKQIAKRPAILATEEAIGHSFTRTDTMPRVA